MFKRRFSMATTRMLLSGVVVTAVALGAPLMPAQAVSHRAAYPPLVVVSLGSPPFVRNFNPLSDVSNLQVNSVARTIYEPLYIVDNTQFKEHPWLATRYAWSKDDKTLTFTIRHGVKWSDGVPFSAQDVYYTLVTLAQRFPTADTLGLWVKGGTNAVSSVTMPAPDQIALHFKAVDLTRFTNYNGLADSSNILPQHIFSRVKNPVTWVEPNPVGTGPFTVVKNFTQQGFDLGKNPLYWQSGKPAFDTLRIAGFTSNDAANLALEAGQIDWSPNLIPHAERVYDARNAAHFHHWYAPSYAAEPLYLNTTRYPFNLVAFRKALSLAINRQALNVNANYGYAPPADVTGIPAGIIAQWRDPRITNALVRYNPAAARSLLLKNGFTYRSGHLIDPHGKAVAFELLPTFTFAEAQILQQNWQALGINVSIRTLQFANYLDRMQKGNFDVVDGWGWGVGPSAYFVYEPQIAQAGSAPLGKVASADFGRWTDPALERLYVQYRATSDVTKQRDLAYQMERIYVNNLPVILTVQAPIPEDYSTVNYTGFPTKEDNYAYGQPFSFPFDTLYMLTRIHPSH